MTAVLSPNSATIHLCIQLGFNASFRTNLSVELMNHGSGRASQRERQIMIHTAGKTQGEGERRILKGWISLLLPLLPDLLSECSPADLTRLLTSLTLSHIYFTLIITVSFVYPLSYIPPFLLLSDCRTSDFWCAKYNPASTIGGVK